MLHAAVPYEIVLVIHTAAVDAVHSDHRLRHYYYRVASSPQWKRIAMNEVNWDSMHGCIHYMKVRFGSCNVQGVLILTNNLCSAREYSTLEIPQMSKGSIVRSCADTGFDPDMLSLVWR